MSNLIEIRIVARDETRGALEATEQQTRALGEQAEQTSSQLTGAGESAQQMGSDVAASGEAMDTAGSSASELSDGAEQAGSALSDTGEDAAGLAGALGETSDGLSDTAAAGSDAASGVAEADDAMGSAADSAAAAAGELGDAAAALGDAGSEAGSAASGFAEAGDSASGLDGSLGDTGDAMAETGAEATVMSDAVREAGASMVGSEAAAGGLFSRLTKLSVALPLAGAGALALTNSTAAMGDQIAKSARTADVSTDFYQDMGFALGQAGVGVDQFDRLLERNVQRMGRAQEGNAKYADAYERLGVVIQDSNGELRASEAVFTDVLHALAGIEDSATRAALAGELLGVRAGRKLAGALESGIDGIEEARQKAHELGIVLGEDALNASEAFNDRMEDMTKAAGSAGREVGTALMPPLTALAELLAGVLSNDLSRNAVLIGGLALAVQHKLAPALKDATKNAGGLRGSLRGLGRALGPAVGVAGVTLLATTVMDAYSRKKAEAKAVTDGYVDALRQEKDAVEGAVREEHLGNLREWVDTLKGAGVEWDVLTDAVESGGDEIDQARDALSHMAGQIQAVGFEQASAKLRAMADGGSDLAAELLRIAELDIETARSLTRDLDELNARFGESTALASELSEAEGDLVESTEAADASVAELEEEVAAATSALDEMTSAMQRALGEAFSLDEAERALQEAVDKARESFAENGHTLDITTEKGRENQAVVQALTEAHLGNIQALIESGASNKQVQSAISEHRSELRRQLGQLGLNKEQTDKYVSALEDATGKFDAEVVLNKAQAEADLAELTRTREVQINANMRNVDRAMSTRGFPVRRHGGITGAQAGGVRDGPTWVGEGGPELVDLPPGSRVHPAGESARLASTEPPVQLTINVNVQGSILAERDLIEVVRDELDRGGFGGMGAVA